MKQLTKDEAIRFYDSGAWKEMTDRQRAEFQMEQDKLCMPFGVFHSAMEAALGRPVWTHEFGLNRDGLRKELFDGAEPPTLMQIIELIPEDKRIVLAVK